LVQQLNFPHPRPSPKGRGETRDSLSQRERSDKRLPLPKGEGRQETPSPFGRGETRDSLALWERAGVRVTNLEILIKLYCP